MATRKKQIPDDCMPKCETCAFFQSEPNADAGYCRRFPPVVVGTEEGEWSGFPMSAPSDWCGEYKRKVN